MIPLSVFCVSWNPTELQFSTICTMVLLPHYLLVFGQNLFFITYNHHVCANKIKEPLSCYMRSTQVSMIKKSHN